MLYTLAVRKEAEADMLEAFKYHESCRENPGSDFLLCVEESFARNSKDPAQYRTIHENVHRALVRRFPYGICYVILELNVSVIGVVHARKNPANWQARI